MPNFKKMARLLKDAREGGFAVSQDALEALVGNLRTTQKGVGQDYTASAAHVLEGMTRLTGKVEKRQERVLDNAQQRIDNRYGSAIAGGVQKEMLKPVERAVTESGKAAKVGVWAGTTIAKAGDTALSIQKSAAKEASGAADYMLAQALAYRARDDASLIAERKMAFQLARQQHQWDVEMYKMQRKDAEDAAEKIGKSEAVPYAEDLSAMLPKAHMLMEQHPDWTWSQVAEALATAGDIPQGYETQASKLLQTMGQRGLLAAGKAGTTDEIVAAVVDTMLRYNPELKKMRPQLEAAIRAQLNMTWSALKAAVLDDPPDDNSGGTSYLGVGGPARPLYGGVSSTPAPGAVGT